MVYYACNRMADGGGRIAEPEGGRRMADVGKLRSDKIRLVWKLFASSALRRNRSWQLSDFRLPPSAIRNQIFPFNARTSRFALGYRSLRSRSAAFRVRVIK